MSDVTVNLDDSVISTAAPFVTNFSRVMAVQMKSQYRLRFGDISTEQLTSEIQTMMDGLLPDRIQLSTSRPDYDSNLFRLMKEIEKGDAWKDTTLSSTGQMILRILAADIDFAQFSIMRALQEAYPHTARNPTSVIAAARSNGVRIQRSLPAQVDVKLTRQDLGFYSIPPWQQWYVGEQDRYFFNRTQINFDISDLELNVTLHQGQVKEATVISSGTPLQVLEIGDETHNISDIDVRVIVDGIEWKRTEGSIWNLKAEDEVFWENTLPNGNMEVRFGDGIWGVSPPPGVEITVQWIDTLGAEGTDPRSDRPVRWIGAPSGHVILGDSIGPVTDGANRLSVNYYRIFSGDRRGADGGSQRRAILRKDFRAHACAYPGVFDAIFRGQAELNPGLRSWMNIVGITILTDPTFTQYQWEDFIKYLKGGNGWPGLTLHNLEMLRLDPIIQIMNIKATIACRIDADVASVKARLLQNLAFATQPRIGSLGFSYYKSDIYDLLAGMPPANVFRQLEQQNTNKKDWRHDLPALIDHVILEEPTTDQIITMPVGNGPVPWIKLGTVELDVRYSSSRRGGYEGYAPTDIPGVTTSG